MNIISRIKDEDIGQRSIRFNSLDLKKGAYGIVRNNDNKIALLNFVNGGYYLLPGGSVDENDDYRSAFISNVFNQTGLKINIEKVIGAIEEERSLKLYRQTSYVFVANILEDGKNVDISNDEVKIEWINEDKALTLVAASYDNLNVDDAEDLYRVKFEVKKSQAILEEYLKSK